MFYSFKRGTALAGLTLCAVGATLAGCNGGSGTTAGSVGSSDALATVGGTKITHADLDTLLEAQSGDQALPYLIDTQLVTESLKAKGLDVSDSEVDADLQRRSESAPNIKAIITAGGPKLTVVKSQVRRELGIQKLATADIKASDAQVKDFFTKNKKYYDTPEKIQIGVLVSSTKVRADAMARSLKDKSKTFEALVAEQLKAQDPAGSQSVAAQPNFEDLSRFGPGAADLVKLPKGGTTQPRAFPSAPGAPPVFVIFKKVDVQPAKPADLVKMRPEIEMDYKLAQIAQKANSVSGKNPPFEQTLVRTQAYLQAQLQQQNPGAPVPSIRDVLSYINQGSYSALMQSLRSAGGVQIDDPNYTEVGKAYQQAATPAPGAAGAPVAGAPTDNTASPASNIASPAANTAAAPAKP